MQEIVIANEIASISCMAYYGYTGWIAFANIRFSFALAGDSYPLSASFPVMYLCKILAMRVW